MSTPGNLDYWRSGEPLDVGASTGAGTGGLDYWHAGEVLDAALTGSGDVSGTIAGTLPNLTAALSGTEIFTGGIAGSLSQLTAALSGTETVAGSIDGTLPQLTASFTPAAPIDGTLAGTLPNLTADIEAVQTFTGGITGTLSQLTAALSGTETITGTVAGALAQLSAFVAASEAIGGTLSGSLPGIVASLTPRLLAITSYAGGPLRSHVAFAGVYDASSILTSNDQIQVIVTWTSHSTSASSPPATLDPITQTWSLAAWDWATLLSGGPPAVGDTLHVFARHSEYDSDLDIIAIVDSPTLIGTYAHANTRAFAIFFG